MQDSEARQIIEDAIIEAARTLGGKYPTEIAKVIDNSSLTVGRDGKVYGAIELVQAFRAEYPRMFRSPEKSGNSPPNNVDAGGAGDDGIRDRARQVITKFKFLFDRSVDLEEVVGEMSDLGSLSLPVDRAEKLLIGRMTTDCHWSRRWGPGGMVASPDWRDPEIFRAMSPRKLSQDEIRKNRETLAKAGVNMKYY